MNQEDQNKPNPNEMKLRECPFCASSQQLALDRTGEMGHQLTVRCGLCGCEGPCVDLPDYGIDTQTSMIANSMYEVALMWNARSIEPCYTTIVIPESPEI